MNDDTAEGYLVTKKYAYFVFALVFIVYMFDYIDRTVVTGLFPFLKRDWGLTDTQCGLLVSAIYWSVLVFTLPVSILVDRWSRRKSLGIMGMFWSLATGLCAFTGNFAQLFTARSLIGAGEAGYVPGGTAMLSAFFPEEKRAQIIGLWKAAIPLGIGLGMVIGGFIAELWGWRHAFGLVAIPGFLLSIIFFFIKDYKTVELVKSRGTSTTVQQSTPDKIKMKFVEIVREFITTPSLIFTYLGFAGNAFVTTALLTWLPTYFHRTDGIPMGKAGLKAGVIMVMAIIGAPLGGFIADRWRKKQINSRLYIASLSSVFAGIFFFGGFVLFEGTTEYIFLLIGGLIITMFVPAATAVTQDVIHVGLRAISYSLCVLIQHLLGSAIGPIFVGAVSDSYSLKIALMFLPIFNLIGFFLFFCSSLFYKRDLEKVEKIQLELDS